MDNWYWIELIGFDNTKEDYAVSDFMEKVKGNISGVSLFLYSSEFINGYQGFDEAQKLDKGYCSYAAHPHNEERSLQIWTHGQLKGLVDTLKGYGVKVVFSTFSTFIYRDNGEIVVGKYGEKHMDIREHISYKFGNFGSVSVIKRFDDGSYYADYLIAKITEIIDDFGFDGMHLADGLPFPIRCLQVGDYSDDLIERFKAAYPVVLPEEINGKCDHDRTLTWNRYRYILENYRYEYTLFMSSAFGEFFKKLYAHFEGSGKILTLNGVWTRDPFEGLFRYGIDNNDILAEKSYAYIFENMGGSLPIFSTQESGGVPFSDEFRKSVQYFFQLTLLSLKFYSPDTEILNLTPIKDTMEQWNLISNHPNMLAKAIAMRNSAFVFQKGIYKKASKGAMYCLSDAIEKSSWDFVKKIEFAADLKQIDGYLGYAFLFNDNVKAEVKKYIETRYLNSFELRKRLISAGLTFGLGTDVDSLERLTTPLVCVNVQDYSKEELAKLEEYKGILIVIARKDVLKKKESVFIGVKNSEVFCKIYNLQKQLESVWVENEKAEVDVSPDDEYEGTWTAKLKYEPINKQFFTEIVSICDRYAAVPKIVKGEARVNAYLVGEKKWRIYVYNGRPHIDIITLSLPFAIKSAKATVVGCNVKSFTKNEIVVKIPNDGVEIIECEEA